MGKIIFGQFQKPSVFLRKFPTKFIFSFCSIVREQDFLLFFLYEMLSSGKHDFLAWLKVC